jgi:hypothetical protein
MNSDTPTPAQLLAAECRVAPLRSALAPEKWTRVVRCAAMAIARREAQRRLDVPCASTPKTSPAKWRGPTFDARRAAANDLSDD